MKRAGIAIDTWKLPIFERHLSEAGYVFEKKPGLTKDMLILMVETQAIDDLSRVVHEANGEAARSRSN